MIHLGTRTSVPMLFRKFRNSSGFGPEHKNRCPFPSYIAALFQHLGTFEAIEYRSYILVLSRLYFSNWSIPKISKWSGEYGKVLNFGFSAGNKKLVLCAFRSRHKARNSGERPVQNKLSSCIYFLSVLKISFTC